MRQEITGNPRKVPLCSWNNSLNIEKNSQQRICTARQVALTTSVGTDPHWVDTVFAGKYPEANLPATHVFGGDCRVTCTRSVQHL